MCVLNWERQDDSPTVTHKRTETKGRDCKDTNACREDDTFSTKKGVQRAKGETKDKGRNNKGNVNKRS